MDKLFIFIQTVTAFKEGRTYWPPAFSLRSYYQLYITAYHLNCKHVMWRLEYRETYFLISSQCFLVALAINL